MKGQGSSFGRLFGAIAAIAASLGLAGLSVSPASASNWGHPSIGMHTTPSRPIVITHGGPVTVKGTTARSRNGDLTIEISTGSASPTTTVRTKTIVDANGATQTIKTIVTTYGETADIVVSGTYTPIGGKPVAYKFTFTSLSAGPQTIGTAPDMLTATAWRKKNTVTVKLARGHGMGNPTVTTKIGQPLVLTGSTGSSKNGEVTIGSVSGDSVTTITTTTTPVLDANGATTTTVTTKTAHARLTDITVTGTYTTAAGLTETYKFTFASLTSPAQTLGSAPDIIKATPSAKTGTITVVHLQGKGREPPSVTVKLGAPDALDGTTGTSGPLTVTSVSGTSVTTVTTTTDPVLESGGATKTTTTVVTTHGLASEIVVSGTYTTLAGATVPYTFTFKSLSAPAQTIGSAPDIIKATPSAKSGTISVVFVRGKGKEPPTVTVNLGSPDTLAGTTPAGKTLTVDSSSGQSVTTITTTSDPTLEPDGATRTTTTVVKTHGGASDIVVSGTYTTLGGATLPYSFTFTSLSGAAQTIGTFPATVTATPDAARRTVTIAFTDGPGKPKNSKTTTTGPTTGVTGATNTTNPVVTVTSLSASTTPVITTTTKEVLNGDGSVTSTTTTVTKYTDPAAIGIAGAYTYFSGSPTPYAFTFSSLSAAAKVITVGEGEAITFTPDAATNSINVVATYYDRTLQSYSVALPERLASGPVTTTSAAPTTTTLVSTIAAPPDTSTHSSSETTPPTTTTFTSTVAAPPATTTDSSSTTTPPTTSTVVSTVAAPPPPSTTSTSSTAPPQLVDLVSDLPPPTPSETGMENETGPIPPSTNRTPAPEPVGTGPPVTVAAVATDVAGEAQIEIARCGVETPPCVADALDAYAAQLDKIASQLPPQMRSLPNVFRETARKVRSAKSGAEARRYVQAAIIAVRHTISLLRADDPDTRALGVEIGTQAVGVLQTASVKLERASQL